MAFIFSCYYLLSKKTVFSQSIGQYTGPHTLEELTTQGILFRVPALGQTVVFERTDSTAKNTDLVVGIPDKLEISWNKMLWFIGQYNIPALLSIRPYTKLAGNATSTDDICITQGDVDGIIIKKNKSVLTKSQVYARLADGRMRYNNNC